MRGKGPRICANLVGRGVVDGRGSNLLVRGREIYWTETLCGVLM